MDITRWPIILGDEGSVTLVKVGENLQGIYQPGYRFVIQPAVDHAPINHIERYRDRGRGVNKIAVGYTIGGHLAEYILITEEILAAGCLLPLPSDQIPYSHAAMAEPMSCVISGQDHHMHLIQDDANKPRSAINGLLKGGVTVIIGAGVMGRFHVDLAFSYQPRAIIVADINEERLELVKSLYALRAKEAGVNLLIINSKGIDLRHTFVNKTNYHGADDVIIAVGAQQPIETAMEFAGQGAVINLFGGLKKGSEVVGFDTIAIHYKSINITGSSGGSPWDVTQTLNLMAKGEINPASISPA